MCYVAIAPPTTSRRQRDLLTQVCGAPIYAVPVTDDIAADRRTLLALTNGFMTSQAIHAFTSLGLAALTGTGRHTQVNLARATESNPVSLRRLLGALAAAGILDEDDQQAYAL